MAVFRVERTRDYTVMCNHHLKDSKPPSMLMKRSSVQMGQGYSAILPQSKFSPRCRNVWSITGRW